jgi:hypothetical protein
MAHGLVGNMSGAGVVTEFKAGNGFNAFSGGTLFDGLPWVGSRNGVNSKH